MMSKYMEHEDENENVTSLQTISTSGMAAVETAPHPICVGTPGKDDDSHCSHEHESQLGDE